MNCPKCNSTNINIQITTDSKLVDKHHGIIWWLFIGWWWIFVKWLFLTIPALFFAIFGHKKQKLVQKNIKNAVCQNCGYSWKIN